MMRPLLLAGAIATVGACAAPTAPDGWEGTFNADEVVRRAVISGGGLATPPGAPRETTATITVARGAARVPSEVMRLRLLTPERWELLVRDSGAGEHAYIYDGGRCVEVRDGAVVRRGLTIHDTGVDWITRHMFLLRWLQFEGADPTRLTGTTTDGAGRTTIELTKSDELGRDLTVSLDAATLNPVRTREWRRIDGRDVEVECHFEAFATDPSGWRYPAEIRIVTPDGEEERLRIVELTRS